MPSSQQRLVIPNRRFPKKANPSGNTYKLLNTCVFLPEDESRTLTEKRSRLETAGHSPQLLVTPASIAQTGPLLTALTLATLPFCGITTSKSPTVHEFRIPGFAIMRASLRFILLTFFIGVMACSVSPARAQGVVTDNLGATRRSNSVSFTITQSTSGNVIDDTQFFVTQHYRDFFSREPDSAGQQFWVDNIDSCGANAACREVKRTDTSAAFYLSIEFQETGYLVHRFYKASFGRRPLLSEFLPDTQTIGNGVVVNAPGWQELLENNKRSFANAWVTRGPFASIYDGLSNEQYVDTLIANTGATFTETDRDALVDVLDNQAMTRAQVLRIVAENEAFYNGEYNAAFVEMQYFGYLRRNPQDAPDNDLSGYNFWLNKLNEFGGDFRRAEMVKAFLVSSEYRQRFGTP